MPLFEYECTKCSKRFELFVTSARRPVCPSCGSDELQKLFSVFGVGGDRGLPGRFTAGGGG
jgi:putative FmdB family regulatory protein